MTLEQFYEVTKDMPKNATLFLPPNIEYCEVEIIDCDKEQNIIVLC